MSLEIWQVVALVIGSVCGPAGAAYVGVKVGLNGVKADVREIKGDVKELRTGHNRNSERIIRLEERDHARG